MIAEEHLTPMAFKGLCPFKPKLGTTIKDSMGDQSVFLPQSKQSKERSDESHTSPSTASEVGALIACLSDSPQ